MNYFIIGLVGALVGALVPAEEGKFVLGFIPLKIFNAMVGADSAFKNTNSARKSENV